MAESAIEAIEEVTGHDRPEPRGVVERYTAWASGRTDPDLAFMVAVAKRKAGHPIAETLFDLYTMEFHTQGFEEKARLVKEWGYITAAEYVATRRKNVRVKGYRLDWGHQAVRDGLCIALWGHLRGFGLAVRAIQFQVGERPYQRIRDHVKNKATDLRQEMEKQLGAAIDLDNAC